MDDKDLQIAALQQMLAQRDQIEFQLRCALTKANEVNKPSPETPKDKENA